MKKRFPGFTVLIERALRLSCVLGVAALAAACGGGEPEDDGADDATTMSVQGTYSAGARRTTAPATTNRTSGIILSEKSTLRPVNGIVLSEKPTGGIVLSELRAKGTAPSQKADDDEAADE